MKHCCGLILVCLFAFQSCTPTRSRQISGANTTYSGTSYVGNYPATGGSTETNQNVPTVFSHCPNLGTNSYSTNSDHVGFFNACQDQSDKGHIALQIQNQKNNQICVFPLHIQNGEMIYIGSMAGCYSNQAGMVEYFNFDNQRPGLAHLNLPINGIMIIEENQIYLPFPFNSNVSTDNAFETCQDSILQGYNLYCAAFVAAYDTYKHYKVFSF